MLRNRSRTMSTKQQTLMADQTSIQSPTQNQNRQNSSFFGSPRFFNGFLESSMSPTSILDDKQFSNLVSNPFGHDKELIKPRNTFPENKHSYEKLESEGIGLALLDSLIDEKTEDDFTKPNSRMVLFGSNLKIQIPNLPSSSSTNSPKSPADFGIKTRNSQFLSTSPAFSRVSSCNLTNDSPLFSLSMSEIELSEDYTCVISHGPNPRTTHIYDNCIVQTSSGSNELSESKDECNYNKNLEESKDMSMSRAKDDEK